MRQNPTFGSTRFWEQIALPTRFGDMYVGVMVEYPNRKLAAIVATDVAGYSRLVEQDEERTIRELRASRGDVIDPLLEKHGGRVANTAGDSLLLEFPSAVEAVRCAIALQRGMEGRNAGLAADRRIDFRIGINVGDVIADGDDLLGNGVNVAARLEALAEPGGICLSRSVSDQIYNKVAVQLEYMGEIDVKNIVRPVSTFRVVMGSEGGLAAPSDAPKSRTRRRHPAILTAVLGLLVIGAAALAIWQPW